MAISHAEGAKALVERAGERAFQGFYSPSIFLLMGFAIELSMKAVFVFLGGDSTALKRIGHDLRAATEAAVGQGFEPPDEELTFVIDALADCHQTNQFRYLDRDTMELPDPHVAVRVVEALSTRVALLVWQDDPRVQALARRKAAQN